jgi:hypothetical protein
MLDDEILTFFGGYRDHGSEPLAGLFQRLVGRGGPEAHRTRIGKDGVERAGVLASCRSQMKSGGLHGRAHSGARVGNETAAAIGCPDCSGRNMSLFEKADSYIL